jgi:hypothetical protein
MTSFKELNAAREGIKEAAFDTVDAAFEASKISHKFCQEVLKTLDSFGLCNPLVAEIYKKLDESDARLEKLHPMSDTERERNDILRTLATVLVTGNQQAGDNAREANSIANNANGIAQRASTWSASTAIVAWISLLGSFVSLIVSFCR